MAIHTKCKTSTDIIQSLVCNCQLAAELAYSEKQLVLALRNIPVSQVGEPGFIASSIAVGVRS